MLTNIHSAYNLEVTGYVCWLRSTKYVLRIQQRALAIFRSGEVNLGERVSFRKCVDVNPQPGGFLHESFSK